MRFYREFLPAQPREVGGFFAEMTVPPADLFLGRAPHAQGVRRHVVRRRVAGRGRAAARAGRHDVGDVLLHGVGPVPHPALQSLFDALYPKGLQYYWRADFFNELSDELAEKHLEWGQKAPTMQSTMHLYPIDGAAHDVGTDDTAFSFRDAQYAEVILGVDAELRQRGHDP